MKKTFIYCIVLLLLISIFSCRRQEIDYGIVADFPIPFGTNSKKCILVITDLDNNVVVEKELTDFSGSSLNEIFTLRLKKPVEVFHVHIILDNPIEDGPNMRIYSHLGLKNTGSFRLYPDLFPTAPPLTRSVKINLGTGNAQQSYHFVGVAANSLSFFPNVLYQTFLQEGQGLVIIRDDLSKAERKRCYLPPEALKDSVYVDPSKFINFSKSIDYTINKTLLENQIQAYATSPDKKEFVHLENNFFDINSIAVPAEVPSNWNYYFNALSPNGGYIEKETKSDVKTVNLNPVTSLKNKSYKEGILSLQCTEGVDWVRVETYYGGPRIFSPLWSIEGHPDQFVRFEVPDLSPYYNNSAKIKDQLFKDYTVTLIHSGEFNYEDMLRGLPWKTGEPFRNGKDGFEKVYFKQ